MNMRMRSFAITLLALLLAACNSHEGLYSPDCIAFAGDKIELSNGQFVWDKFTDALIVDEDGNLVDQFPGYPMHGTYQIDGETVTFALASGEAPENMYLRQDGDRHYLLTTAQFEEWQSTGKYVECALIPGGNQRD